MWLRDVLWVTGERTKKKACVSQSESHKFKKKKESGRIVLHLILVKMLREFKDRHV